MRCGLVYTVCVCTQVHTVTFTPPPPQPPYSHPQPLWSVCPGHCTWRHPEVPGGTYGACRGRQGPHCTGKNRESGVKKNCMGKHMEFGNFANSQGISYSQVVNFLILKIRILLYVPALFHSFSEKLNICFFIFAFLTKMSKAKKGPYPTRRFLSFVLAIKPNANRMYM